MVTPVALGETLVTGNTYTLTLTLTQDGATYDLSVGGDTTVICSIRPENSFENVLTDASVTVTTAASGIVVLPPT